MFKKFAPTQLYITPSGSWVTVSHTSTYIPLSSILPADTAALFLHVVASGGNEYLGLRKPGSSDNRTQMMPGNSHQWTVVGVDAGITFQAFLSNNLSQSVYLVGYMTAESGVILNNGVSQTGTNWAWVEKDLSAICPGAIAVIFEMLADGMFYGLRPHGSTQDRYQAGYYHSWGVIGCDINQHIDYYKSTATQYLYIIGYITQDAVFPIDAEDLSLSTTGIYESIDLSGKNAELAFIDVLGMANQKYALREAGSAEDIYRNLDGQHNWGIIGVSDAGFIEGKIQATDVDFWLVGFAEIPVIATPANKGPNMAHRLVAAGAI
ncbi:MAG: hypothetical protein WC455_20925 [Dehalococcoidia bacterium]|jgi:hypothetical protein